MSFRDFCRSGKCEVCGKKGDVVVCASTMGPVSYAYCEDCFESHTEPYGAMVAYISFAGTFPGNINEAHQTIVRKSLTKLGRTEEEFINDVNKCIDDMNNTY